MTHKQCLSLILATLLLLSGCGDKDKTPRTQKASSKTTTSTTQSPKSSAPPPATQQPKKESVEYTGRTNRNPFTQPQVKATKVPNVMLHEFSLNSIKLVGIIELNNKKWAIIRTPNGKIYRITIGQKLSSEQAEVTEISKNEVKLKSGDGVLQKTYILRLEGRK